MGQGDVSQQASTGNTGNTGISGCVCVFCQQRNGTEPPSHVRRLEFLSRELSRSTLAGAPVVLSSCSARAGPAPSLASLACYNGAAMPGM